MSWSIYTVLLTTNIHVDDTVLVTARQVGVHANIALWLGSYIKYNRTMQLRHNFQQEKTPKKKTFDNEHGFVEAIRTYLMSR